MRGTRQRGWSRGAAAAIGAAGLMCMWVLAEERPSAVQQLDTGVAIAALDGPVGTLRADIAIRQRQVRVDGRPGRADSPPARLRLDRRQVEGRWRSTLTIQASPATIRTSAGLVPLENPFEVGRLEIDEDTGRGRLFDRFGRPAMPPGAADRARLGITDAQLGAGWRDRLMAATAQGRSGPGHAEAGAGFLLERRQMTVRRARLENRMGRPAGQIRGLNRFVAIAGGQTVELLADPATAAPVEINTLERGVLRTRLSMAYTAAGRSGHLRHALTSERLLGSAVTDDRLITDVTLSNVALAAGGVQ
jgi:hypothetical protein